MKMSKKAPKLARPETVVKKTRVEQGASLGELVVTHHQQVKQSLDYQSADAGYSIQFSCKEDEFEDKLMRVELLIEEALGRKVEQQNKLLRALGSKNR